MTRGYTCADYVSVILGKGEIEIYCDLICSQCDERLEFKPTYQGAQTGIELSILPCANCFGEGKGADDGTN